MIYAIPAAAETPLAAAAETQPLPTQSDLESESSGDEFDFAGNIEDRAARRALMAKIMKTHEDDKRRSQEARAQAPDR